MCTVVNVLNENTFASTSPLLQPRKSVSRTTDYGQWYGKEFFDMFLRLRIATPRQRDLGYAGQQTTDNESGGNRSHGITELRIYGIMEASPRQRVVRSLPIANSQRPTADSSAAATCSLVVS